MTETTFWAIMATVAVVTFAFGAFLAYESERDHKRTMKDIGASKRAFLRERLKITIENDRR
jgi:hypothetical protein